MTSVDKSYQRELELAKSLALEAGDAVMDFYKRDYDVEKKSDDSPLTEADLVANKIIVEGLRKNFPDYGLLTEEESDDKERLNKEHVWIVDPIDGTKEFISKNGEFTINIALVQDHKVVLGVVYAPAVDKLYYGSDHAFLVENGKEEQIQVSDETDSSKLVLVRSRSHMNETTKKFTEKAGFKKVVPTGSSLKGCCVSSGEADVYPRFGPQKEWDIAAMQGVINGSGAEMVLTTGEDVRYNREDSLITEGFIVANPKNIDRLIKIYNEVKE